MPFGIRARGRSKRKGYQQAGLFNRVANAMDPGVRSLQPPGQRAKIRGIRNVAMGQHTAQAEGIRRGQEMQAEQMAQNEFNRQAQLRSERRQAALDKENKRRFDLLRGDRLKTDAERESESAKARLDRMEEMQQAGRLAGRATRSATRGRLQPATSPTSRTSKPMAQPMAPGELPKQPSKTKDYWISALEKFSPKAFTALTKDYGVEAPDPGQGAFAEGIRVETGRAKATQQRKRNEYLDALDEYARRNPQGTEADAVRFAAKAAGLEIPSEAEESAGVRELFSPTTTPEQRRQAARTAAGRKPGKAAILPRRSLAPQSAQVPAVGTTPTLGPQTRVAPEATSSRGGAPFPGGNEPTWYRNLPPRSLAPQPAVAPAESPSTIPNPAAGRIQIPAGGPGFQGFEPRRISAPELGAATVGDVGKAVVGTSPLGFAARGADMVTGGPALRDRDRSLTIMQAAQEKLRSGAVPQDQRAALSRTLQAMNNLMNKENRTPQEETLLQQALERIAALYGG